MKDKCSALQNANFRQEEARLWTESGFNAEHVSEWKSAGFNWWRTASTWRDAGFTAEEAAAWKAVAGEKHDNVITPSEAAGAKKAGETPVTYKRNRYRTYPHPMKTR
jgi:hypothetical protein